MAEAADAIVIARYTGRQRLVVDKPEDRQSPFSTDHTFEILSVVKSHFLTGKIGEEFEVNLDGGVRDVGNERIERVLQDANPLRANADYVVFLKKNEVRPELYLAWQQDALFELTASGIQSMGRLTARQDGKTRESFLAEIQGGETTKD